jgi:hypothetical protein
MSLAFLNNKQAQDKIAELSAKLRAKGVTPKDFGSFTTSQEAHAAINFLEGQLSIVEGGPMCSATPPPLPPSQRPPVSAAAQAMLDAAKAKAEAKAAGDRAKSAVAALPTAPVAVSAKPTKFASTSLEFTIKTALNALAPEPDREQAVAELTQRGLTASKQGVTMDRDMFGMISSEARAEFCRAGGKLTEPKNAKAGTSYTEDASAMELVFPEPVKSPRTAEQFMALSETAIGKINLDCQDERKGGSLRQELYDARERINWKPGAILSRSDFTRRFSHAFNAVSKYGPECATWEDPAPPVSANAMTARQWTDLSPAQIGGMATQLTVKSWGRNIRAELKRAYRDGSPAEKSALRAIFNAYAVSPLQMYPSELI